MVVPPLPYATRYTTEGTPTVGTLLSGGMVTDTPKPSFKTAGTGTLGDPRAASSDTPLETASTRFPRRENKGRVTPVRHISLNVGPKPILIDGLY